MDVFEKVRETKPEIDGADENLSAARAMLLAEIGGERATAPSRSAKRPILIGAGLVGAAAAVTAGVLVMNALAAPAPTVEAVPTREPGVAMTPSPAPQPTPETAPQVLQGAATVAESFVPIEPGPGQYLRLAWTQDELGLYQDDYGVGSPGWGGSRTTATSGWLMRSSGAVYVPADRSLPWTTEWGQVELGEFFGDRVEAENHARPQLERFQSLLDPSLGTYEPTAPFEVDGSYDLDQFLAALPRDPDAMISWIRDRMGDDKEGWVDGKVGWVIIGLLADVATPQDRKAEMYRALSRLPGSTVGPLDAGTRTVVFDSQLAWDAGTTATTRYTLTIDMSTGAVTEITRTFEFGEGTIVPQSVPDIRATYSQSIVDAIP